ncbi:sterol desaturase family protein [Amphiplicatus metriothermophilus]|uniref:Sterol desaturase/sphingolipid hydroxylase, fatty acid hydroxylase superfamily n=1 Tax=Amphiplicatus metriothermophilus TaxID=1519374 RepID=A0A239PQU9_9PROT|nr:sterol desaturase family protein [Amphiplicatus metriothermophilus]MBB5518415.1 sterol desaturase/sphingolipid hydroxylase (fatty acid hydroxylase superfamily) [Amphiplicatus metriothermophilus]SNT72423.1 Sterol desaturase/sphingolipid hydroxylase, fatty acid hydroxylase superfamily [Amphiplicatus metriothermophilus]
MQFPDVVTMAVPAFVLLVLIEMALWRATGRGNYETRDAAASLVMGLGSQIAPLFGGGALVFAAFVWAYEYRLFDIPNTWQAILLCFVLDDLRYYWWHRISHERRWFWASHVVHHSSQHYNLTTALRQTWTGQILGAVLFKTPLVFLGFHPAMVVFVGGLNLVYQFWIHTEQIGRLGPLEWVFNTPSHHRVHHATNARYIDANYGGTLIVWDRIFGTFVPEDDAEKPRYGIVKNLGSFNPLVISFHEWIAMARDVLSARSPREVLGYLFGPPGWSPDGSRLTSKMIKERWARLRAQADAPAPKAEAAGDDGAGSRTSAIA